MRATRGPKTKKQQLFSIQLPLFCFDLARLRTYPQHTLPSLPLLRSRPGGVRKASVVRSPKSDNFSNVFDRCFSGPVLRMRKARGNSEL